MDRIESSPVIADHEIIYKNDKPYIILDLKEYERLVHSSKTIKAANSKQKKEFIKINNVTLVRTGKVVTGKDFMKGLTGIWKNRKDITDSVEFVQNLRKNATRPHIKKQMREAGL